MNLRRLVIFPKKQIEKLPGPGPRARDPSPGKSNKKIPGPEPGPRAPGPGSGPPNLRGRGEKGGTRAVKGGRGRFRVTSTFLHQLFESARWILSQNSTSSNQRGPKFKFHARNFKAILEILTFGATTFKICPTSMTGDGPGLGKTRNIGFHADGSRSEHQ